MFRIDFSFLERILPQLPKGPTPIMPRKALSQNKLGCKPRLQLLLGLKGIKW